MKTIIDISSHTTINNYDSLTKFDGVYIKATEGCTFVSPTLDTQVQECIKRKIPFGLYHFAGHLNPADREYNFYKSICEKYPQRTLPDCLDYENKEENIQFISDFMKLDNSLIFYSYRSIVNKCIKYFLPKNKIWVAIPSKELQQPSDLSGYLGIQYLLSYTPPNQDDIINYDCSVFEDSIYSNIYIDTDTNLNIKESVKMRAIKQGEFSQRVQIIQAMLNTIIGSQLTIDGKFGTNTYNAIRDYQQSRGLEVDGIVGINTTNSLINDISNILKA
jgi:hypothetical protein